MAKLNIQLPLLQSSLTNDNSEIITIFNVSLLNKSINIFLKNHNDPKSLDCSVNYSLFIYNYERV